MIDSRIETAKHVQIVRGIISVVVADLERRSSVHDASKFDEPELSYFDEFTPSLSRTTYDSEEYKKNLKLMKPALDHHYAVNDHHPEHYTNGILGMSLVVMLEMLIDWKAASLRHVNGDILVSIEKNQKRYGFSDDVKQLLINTVPLLEVYDATI